MGYYAVFGDIHPSMMVRIDDLELKEIKTKLAIGIKPEDIRLTSKVRDGSRNLGTEIALNLNDKLYLVISKGAYLCLEYTDETDF